MNKHSCVVVLALPGNERLAADLAAAMHTHPGELEVHRFPDQESRIRLATDVGGCDVVIACTLDHPNDKLVELYLTAATLKQLGSRKVLLAAPYLPYMRQDCSFHGGEGISAVHIGAWLSGFLDGLVTVDPHLHRIARLQQVYSIPMRVVHAAPAIARWIREQVPRPVVVGPDQESRQWVSEVAAAAACPWLVLDKTRHGDRDVEVRLPESAADLREHTPVVLDDIVSSGYTMLAAVKQLRATGFPPSLCVGVHALFDQEVAALLHLAGAARLVTCNTVRHPTNAIDINGSVAFDVRQLLDVAPSAESLS